MESASASAPGKIILLGEHAVVYGVPAIAIPVPGVYAHVVVSPAPRGSGILLENRTTNEVSSVGTQENSIDPISRILRRVLDLARVDALDATLTLESSIPIASGLGSGAAISAAVGRALSRFLNLSLDDHALNAMVYEVEKLHHGTPSGIDNTVIVFEQPIYFQREHPIEMLSVGAEFTFLIADTGVSAPTKSVVEDVRHLRERHEQFVGRVIDEIAALVVAARIALARGDAEAVGALMSANHVLLQSLTVSSCELDDLVSAARSAGALGAKLSGGGRGGNMIALVPSPNVQRITDALLSAGAVRVIKTVLR